MHKKLIHKGERIMCNENKKSVKTTYDGIEFRSKTEARFAVVLNTLKIEYKYEPECMNLSNGLKYLPDFYLPQFDQWVEVKGVMEEYDEQKISCFEADSGSQMIIVESSLMMHYFHGDEVFLTEDGFTTEPSDYAKEAFQKAQVYKFETKEIEEKVVEKAALTRLFDLKATQLNSYYKIDCSEDEPKIVNVVTDTHNNYLDTNFRIYIYASEREDFKIILCDPEETEIFSFSVKEVKTAEACRKVFKIAYDLYSKEQQGNYKHSTILSDGLNSLAEWLQS